MVHMANRKTVVHCHTSCDFWGIIRLHGEKVNRLHPGRSLLDTVLRWLGTISILRRSTAGLGARIAAKTTAAAHTTPHLAGILL